MLAAGQCGGRWAAGSANTGQGCGPRGATDDACRERVVAGGAGSRRRVVGAADDRVERLLDLLDAQKPASMRERCLSVSTRRRGARSSGCRDDAERGEVLRMAPGPPCRRGSRQDRLLSLRATPRAGSGSRGSWRRRWRWRRRRAGGAPAGRSNGGRRRRGKKGGEATAGSGSGRKRAPGRRVRGARVWGCGRGQTKKWLGGLQI